MYNRMQTHCKKYEERKLVAGFSRLNDNRDQYVVYKRCFMFI